MNIHCDKCDKSEDTGCWLYRVVGKPYKWICNYCVDNYEEEK